jgi:hypothetical protein
MRACGRTPALAAGFVLTLSLAACASAPPREARVRSAIAEGRYRDAAAATAGERDELLRHLDRGLALFYARDPRASNLSLGRADAVIEDRATRSLSRAALSLLVNDTVLPYRPDPWERLMIPLYRALNYVRQEAPDDAVVEARRLSALLLERRDRHPARATEENDAFLYLVAGTLFDWAGRREDAGVAYRNARQAYGPEQAPPPAWMGPGFEEDSTAARPGAPPPVVSQTSGRSASRGAGPAAALDLSGGAAGDPAGSAEPGEIVLLVETGLVAAPVEELLLLFLSEDDVGHAREDPERFGEELAKRHLEGRDPDDDDESQGYLLPIALRSRSIPVETPARATLELDGRSQDLPVGFDLSRAAALAYQDELPALLAKTAARTLVKTLVFKETTEHEKPIVRILANALHVATERADTRAWLTLPGELRFARLAATPGTHDLRLTLSSPDGATRVLSLPGVRVEAGRPTLVSARVEGDAPASPAVAGGASGTLARD